MKYLGTYKDRQKLNIFLEFVPGGSLEKIYKTYPMNENLIRVYTKQILEGIEYLHVNNVIHRDIKAANILVDSSGTCKLADFGSSKKIYGSLVRLTKFNNVAEPKLHFAMWYSLLDATRSYKVNRAQQVCGHLELRLHSVRNAHGIAALV